MTRPSLADIEECAAVTTEGPWSAGRGCVVAPADAPNAAHNDAANVRYYGGALIGESIARAEDRAFIAAARTDIPAMSAAIRDVLAIHIPEKPRRDPDFHHTDRVYIECGDPFPCRTYAAITAHIDTTPKEGP